MHSKRDQQVFWQAIGIRAEWALRRQAIEIRAEWALRRQAMEIRAEGAFRKLAIGISAELPAQVEVQSFATAQPRFQDCTASTGG